MKDILSRLDDGQREKLGEIVRFGIVGVIAVGIQYGVYLLLLHRLSAEVANTIAYVVSVIFNFLASTYYTFRVKASVRRGAGFALSHVVNYLLQTAVLAGALWVGVPKTLAPIPMFAICVPVNFLLVRFFLKR